MLGQADKALADLNTYFAKAYHHSCKQPFQLRAEAYRQLGRIDLALSDEQKIREMPDLPGCNPQQ